MGVSISKNAGFAVEGADLLGESVEVVETAVAAVGRHSCHVAHSVEIPRGENQQAAVGAGVETAAFGFPVRADGLVLQVDEGVAFGQAFVLHQLFAARDAGGDDDGLAGEDGGEPAVVLGGVVGGGLVGEAADGVPTVALHLHLAGPAQEEEIAEGAIAAPSDADMEAAAHHVGQPASQERPAGVVVHIGYHCLAVALVEADGVVVVVVEQGALAASDKSVVFLPLPVGEAADEGAFAVVDEGLRAEPDGGVGALAIDRDRSIAGGREALHDLPAGGAGGLESLDDVAQAPRHGLEHLDDAVEMVGHADRGVHLHTVAVGGLDGRGLLPGLEDGFAEGGGEQTFFAAEIGCKGGEQGLTAAHDKCDQIDAAAVVVVAGIAWAIGGDCHYQEKPET